MSSILFPMIGIVAVAAAIAILIYIRKKKEAERQEQLRIIENLKEKYNTNFRGLSEYLKKGLLDSSNYFCFSDMEKLKSDASDFIKVINDLNNQNIGDLIPKEISEFYNSLINIESIRKSHNNQFVEKELQEEKEFFNTVLKYPLDSQQRESIVKLEDNCLVVSSAGSGKTSTMIGKLLYLVKERKVSPSRILTITYTHKAADELSQRLLGTGISCLTFHKLAMNIISRIEGKAPSIADDGLFIKVFYDTLKKADFRKAILNYLTDYKSMVKNEHDYDTPMDYYRDRKKYGVIALYSDKDEKLISTKSEEEKNICSYLTELGVRFKYEEPYPFETYTEDYRQYKPDFTIYYNDKEGKSRKLYLEHFALDSNNLTPRWFGYGRSGGWKKANDEYHIGMDWKILTHRKYGTKLVYTTSADFHNHSIRTKLRRILNEVEVPINEPTVDELIEKIFSRNKSLENALLQMTQSFINLVKTNEKNIDDIKALAEKNGSKRDVYVIENIMKPLWSAYQQELANRGEMDFTDVIIKATNYCKEGKWNSKYEYILVDEFQDISIDRYKFLLSLRTDLPKTKLYCVGDDWQSIYRFSGSDMSLFSEFDKYFGFTEICKIETTYRFGNPLIEESSKFIQMNPIQRVKNVRPRQIDPPSTKISLMGYSDNEELQSLVARMIERVPNDKSIYIISRYTHDVNSLIGPSIKMDYDRNTDAVNLTISNRKVSFLTIHSAKGLEADYVFMLNCNSGLYGFPSLVSDDPVLDYVLSDPEHFEYGEERRVFYVGITRAKIHTVVMYDKNSPSPFLSEIDEKIIQNPNPCPLCGVGHRIVKYEGWTKQKTPYRVWGCDNRAANCQYFEREFSNGNYMNLTGKKLNIPDSRN